MKAPALSLAAFLALAGCKEKLSYAEPDVGASENAFGCARSPTGDAADACRMLKEFRDGGMVTTLPTGGMHTWWGEEQCSDSLDRPNFMLFGWVHISPGAGDAHDLHDIETIPERTLPYHADLPTMSVSDITKDGLAAYQRLVEAAKSGTQPNLDGLGPAARDNAARTWKAIQQSPVANPPKMRLTKSDEGKTVLANNATIGNDQGFVTYINLRQKGDKIYQLKPGKDAHCISELHLVK